MRQPKTKFGKILRRATIALLSVLFAGAAISPSLAAGNLNSVDRSAIALAVVFAVLIAAIVYEVWRLSHLEKLPMPRTKQRDWTTGFHE